jgi:hypothetical protein
MFGRAFQTISVFSGSRGTITIAQQAHYTGGLPQGTWQVRSGTGAYEGLSGHGTFAFSPPNDLTFTGLTSKAEQRFARWPSTSLAR